MSDFKTLYHKLCLHYHVEKQPGVVEALTTDGYLNLSQQTLSTKTCAVLEKIFETCKEITKVSLENCLLEEESLRLVFLGLGKSSSVVNLNLKGNAIQGSCAHKIADLLKTNTSIKSLSLEWNNLGLCRSSFAQLCGALRHNRSLLKLDLRSNQLTSDHAPAIAEVIKNSSLTTLDIRFNNLGDEGGKIILLGFRNFPNLKQLLINGNNISSHIMDGIASRLSNNLKLSGVRQEYITQANTWKQRLEIQEQQASLQIENLERNLTNANESLASVIKESREKIANLEDDLANTSQELQRVNSKCENLSQTAKERERLIDQTNRQSKATKEELQSERENRNRLLLEMDELRGLPSRLEAAKEEIFVLKDNLISLEAELKATKLEAEERLEAERCKHKEALKKQEKSFASQTAKLKQEMAEKEADLKKSKRLWESTRDDLETETRRLKTSLSALNEEHHSHLSSLRHQLKRENRDEMRILENEVKESDRNREEVEAKLRSQISACASLASTNARQKSQINSLNSELASLQAELEGKEENIREAEKRVRSEVKNQLHELQNLKEEKIKLESDFDLEQRKREQIVKEMETYLQQKEDEIQRLKSLMAQKERDTFRQKDDETKRINLLHSAIIQYLQTSED